MNTEITIHLLNDADIPKIPDFFDGLSEASRYFYHPYTFDQNAVSRTARELHDAKCAHIGAFYDDEGGEKMVGHVWYIGGGSDNYPTLGIGIIDTFQNRGIGKTLMQRIEAVARARGEQGIQLTCFLENDRAIRVYTKQGYRIVGKTEDGRQFRMVHSFADGLSSIRGVNA